MVLLFALPKAPPVFCWPNADVVLALAPPPKRPPLVFVLEPKADVVLAALLLPKPPNPVL